MGCSQSHVRVCDPVENVDKMRAEQLDMFGNHHRRASSTYPSSNTCQCSTNATLLDAHHRAAFGIASHQFEHKGWSIPSIVSAPFGVPDDSGDRIFESMTNSVESSRRVSECWEVFEHPVPPNQGAYEKYISTLEGFMDKVQAHPEGFRRSIMRSRGTMPLIQAGSL